MQTWGQEVWPSPGSALLGDTVGSGQRRPTAQPDLLSLGPVWPGVEGKLLWSPLPLYHLSTHGSFFEASEPSLMLFLLPGSSVPVFASKVFLILIGGLSSPPWLHLLRLLTAPTPSALLLGAGCYDSDSGSVPTPSLASWLATPSIHDTTIHISPIRTHSGSQAHLSNCLLNLSI